MRPHCPSTWTAPRSPAWLLHPPTTGQSNCRRPAKVVDAEQRRPKGVIHHSDQGTQYTSVAFGLRCRKAGVRPSMGSVGDCFDNAMCESFFATLECELLDRRRFKNQEEARRAIFEFLEGWYNLHRRHSSLGYLSPAEFEKQKRAA